MMMMKNVMMAIRKIEKVRFFWTSFYFVSFLSPSLLGEEEVRITRDYELKNRFSFVSL